MKEAMIEAVLGFNEWEIWMLFGLWMLIPIAVYYAKKQDEKIAVMQRETDKKLREWLKEKNLENFK